MAHEKMETEMEYFTSSDFHENRCRYNPHPERVHACVSREMKRRLLSNAPSNKSNESLEVVVRRVSELTDKENDF